MFGHTPESAELRSSVLGYVELLNLNPRPEQLIIFAGVKLISRQSEVLSKIGGFATLIPDLSEDAQSELKIFVSGIEQISGLRKRLGQSDSGGKKSSSSHGLGHLIEAIYDDLDGEAVEWRQDQRLLDKEFREHLLLIDEFQAEQLSKACALYYEAISTTGVDRGQFTREAKSAFVEQSLVSELGKSPYIWLHVAVSSLAASCGVPEVLPLLFRGLEDSLTEHKLSYCVSARLAAGMLMRERAYDQAYDVLRRAAAKHKTATLSMEMAICAAKRGLATEAICHLEKAMRARPATLLAVLAELDLVPISGTLLATILQFQRQERKEAFHAVAAWAQLSTRIEDIFKKSGIAAILGSDFLSGHKDASESLASANLFVSRRIKVLAQINQKQMGNIALEAGQKELTCRQEAVRLAKKTLEDTWECRESEVTQALGIQQSVVLAARKTLNMNDSDSDQVQRGCLTGMGLSASLFVAYCLAVTIAGSHGTNIGVGTPGGTISILTALIPACLAMINQVAYGIKRISLEAELAKYSSVAQRNYQNAVKQADARYKDRLAAFRAEVSEKEEALAKVVTCLKLLQSTE